MTKSPFTRQDAWSYYHAIYLPSMTYPFPSSTLSSHHCTLLQRKFKTTFLPKYGFNRSTPNAVIYGPSHLGGLELRQLAFERGISQVYILLAALRSSGVAQELALIAISWGQFLSGVNYPILSNPRPALPHLDPMVWISQVRDFLGSLDCHIELSQTFLPELQRENDLFLMEHALTQQYGENQLRLLNACRIFLGVTLLSDIVSADGLSLRESAIQHVPDSMSAFRGHIPYQSYPSTATWNVWADSLLSLTDHTSSRLTRPLGPWKKLGASTYRQWYEYLDQDTNVLYVFDNGLYRHHISFYSRYVPTDHVSANPTPIAVPVSTKLDGYYRILLPYCGSSTDPAPPIPTTLDTLIASLPLWEKTLLNTVTLICPIDDLVAFFSTDDISFTFCSDGSAAGFLGKFGCVGSSPDGTRLFQIQGPAPGF